MNSIRCPQCSLLNPLSAAECQQCRFPFVNLPPTAFVSAPVEEIYQTQNPNFQLAIPQDNETGRKTFLWYRVYCGVLAALYLLVAVMGVLIAVIRPQARHQSAEETLIMGIVYAVLGVIFLLVYVIALFLPRKSWNWIVGIVMIALGMTSCCTLPFLVPLFIYWLKPETKAYFGRN